ncbi:MAG: hypothetical protein JWO46_1424 [Nocardioidaceae bacterium]|nr:hypothetical protein [Nocardioidaceae bacterium]
MPAGSEVPVDLPHTWRPLGTRMVGYVSGFGLVAIVAGGWFALGDDIRATFTTWQRVTCVVLGLLAAAVWYALVRPRLTATTEGVVVVNGYRVRRLDWAQVVSVRLRRGAPWAEMDVSDGTSIAVMALQGSDGDRARDALKEFGVLLRAQTKIDRDG